MTTITSIRQANTKIKAIGKARVKIQEDIHNVAMFGLNHYKEHNDGSILSNLAKAVQAYNKSTGKFDERNSAMRGSDLRKWVKDFGGVKWSKKAYGAEGGFVFDSKASVHRGTIDLEAANATPFWSYSADKEATAMDPTAVLRQVRDRIRKAASGEAKSQFIEQNQMALATSVVNGITELLAQLDGVTNSAIQSAVVDAAEALAAPAKKQATTVANKASKKPAKKGKKAA